MNLKSQRAKGWHCMQVKADNEARTVLNKKLTFRELKDSQKFLKKCLTKSGKYVIIKPSKERRTKTWQVRREVGILLRMDTPAG